jgi:hypothetical protein
VKLMSSLFGHLVTRFTPGPENLATEALAYILSLSPAARTALNRIPASLDLRLPEIRSFRTQAWGEDSAIPDLAGFDALGTVRVLVENKFWAGLTPNQPVAYLERLPADAAGLLLFVVPRRRLHAMWADLATSAERAGVRLPAATAGSDLVWGRLGERTLAVTSWPALLERLEAEARTAGEVPVLSDLAQLRGLCEHMDSAGYVPATLRELTDMEVPRRLLAVADLVPEMCDRAIAAGIADGKGLRPTHFPYGSGRYIRIGVAGGWVGVDHRHWARYGIGPLWITFGVTEFGRGPAVLDALAAWVAASPPKAFSMDGSAVVPLRITPGATRDIVLDDLLAQLKELHGILEGLRMPFTAAPPALAEASA